MASLNSPHKLRKALVSVMSEVEKEEETTMKDAFKAAFEAKVLYRPSQTNDNQSPSPKSKSTSKTLTREEWERKVDIIQNWDKKTSKERKDLYSLYKNWRHKFKVTTELSGKKTLRQEGKIVIPIEEVFDVIYNFHISHSHQGGQTLHNVIKKSYYTITRKMVIDFCKMCPVCCTQQQAKKKPKGAVKPIESQNFRDRAEMDLIDFSTNPQPLYWYNKDSPKMHWLLVIKDHLTRFVWAAPLPSKTPVAVAHEAIKCFNQLGYPLILHTDNGTEFGQEMMDHLNEANPLCHTVKGRVRTPRDQGSVESANKTLKKLIQKLVIDKQDKALDPGIPSKRKKRYESASWVTEYSQATSTMNASKRPGPNEISPYETVHGRTYDEPLVSAMYQCPDLYKVSTINEMLNHCSTRYRDKLAAMGELPQDYARGSVSRTVSASTSCAAAESQYPTPRQLSYDESPTASLKSPTATMATASTVAQISPNLVPKSPSPVAAPVTESPPAAPVTKSTPAAVAPVTAVAGTHTGNQRPSSTFNRTLHCNQCFKWLNLGSRLVPAFSPQFLAELDKPTEWFTTAFAMAFCRHKTHDIHNNKIVFLECYYPHETIEKQYLLPEGVDTVVLVANASDHFALLVFSVSTKTISVFDGLNKGLNHWHAHCLWCLKYLGKTFNVAPDACKAKRYLKNRRESIYDYGPESPSKTTLWEVSHHPGIRQNDAFSCGPIACYNYWRLLDPDRCPDITDATEIRAVVMTEYREMVLRHQDHLQTSGNSKATLNPLWNTIVPESQRGAFQEMLNLSAGPDTRAENKEQHQFVAVLKQRGEAQQQLLGLEDNHNDDDEDDDEEFLSRFKSPFGPKRRIGEAESACTSEHKRKRDQAELTDSNRKKIMLNEAFSRERQAKRAKKMKADFRKSVPDLKKGDTVTLSVLPNERSGNNTSGILAVVYAFSPSTKSIKAVTEKGIPSDRKGPMSIAHDRYWKRECPLRGGLAKLKEEIVSGNFIPGNYKWKTIATIHKEIYHGRPACGKCRCENGCGNSCSCRRGQIPCSSKCKCGANCSWTFERQRSRVDNELHVAK